MDFELQNGDKIEYNFYGEIKSGIICGSNKTYIFLNGNSEVVIGVHKNWLNKITKINNINISEKDSVSCDILDCDFILIDDSQVAGGSIVLIDGTLIENGYSIQFINGKVFLRYDSGETELFDDEEIIWDTASISEVEILNGNKVDKPVKFQI